MTTPLIWLVGGEKGGVGKSTIAVNLAAALALSKRATYLIDTDHSGDAFAWLRDRPSALPQIYGKHDTLNVVKTATSFSRGGHDVVIDAGGQVTDTLLRAMSIADIMLMPMCPSQFDLFSAKRMARRVEEARHWNPKLRAMFFINRADPTHHQDAFDALELLVAFKGVVEVASTVIVRRVVWSRSAGEGRAVFEMKNGDKASEEFWNLLAEVGVLEEET